jgi:hypothetical protein
MAPRLAGVEQLGIDLESTTNDDVASVDQLSIDLESTTNDDVASVDQLGIDLESTTNDDVARNHTRTTCHGAAGNDEAAVTIN